MTNVIDKLMERGYNAGAATWAAEQIQIGNGTLDQYLFDALNLRLVAKRNAEHDGYTGQEPKKEEPATRVVSTRVRPGGAYANYLAYGHIKADGTFQRAGYPKDVFKPIYGESWGKRGGAQYEYEVSFNVPAKFPYHIVKVYSKTAVQHASIEILFTPNSGNAS